MIGDPRRKSVSEGPWGGWWGGWWGGGSLTMKHRLSHRKAFSWLAFFSLFLQPKSVFFEVWTFCSPSSSFFFISAFNWMHEWIRKCSQQRRTFSRLSACECFRSAPPPSAGSTKSNAWIRIQTVHTDLDSTLATCYILVCTTYQYHTIIYKRATTMTLHPP